MSSENPLAIILDVDRTLLNTDLLTTLFLKEIQKLFDQKIDENQFSAEELLDLYKSSIQQDEEKSAIKFVPEEFLEFIIDQINQELEIGDLENSFYNPEIYKPKKIVFPDVLEFLQIMLGDEYSHVILGIFSEGMWQDEKLELTGLNKYLTTEDRYRLIFENKLSEEAIKKLSELPDGTIIVDDRLEILEKIAKLMKEEEIKNQLVLIYINRAMGERVKEGPTPHPSIITINKLTDLLDLAEINLQPQT